MGDECKGVHNWFRTTMATKAGAGSPVNVCKRCGKIDFIVASSATETGYEEPENVPVGEEKPIRIGTVNGPCHVCKADSEADGVIIGVDEITVGICRRCFLVQARNLEQGV